MNLKGFFKKKFGADHLKHYRKLYRRRSEYFATTHIRPKMAANYGLRPDSLRSRPASAIVIQGPLVREDDFTLETIRIYRRIFPGAELILSTWDTEDQICLERISREKAKIILNAAPEYRGISNINMQICSSRAGVAAARSAGAEFIMKTRTDQRIYNHQALEFLLHLLDHFPPAAGFAQKKRIIGASLNTFKTRLYGLSDMFLFGTAEDMEKYWSVPYDSRKLEDVPSLADIGQFCRSRLTEVYLASNYLEKIGRRLNWTLADSWQAFRDNLLVINHIDLDLYWRKYDSFKEFRYAYYANIRNDREMSFSEWFNIYSGLDNKDNIPESALAKGLRDAYDPDLI